MNPDLLWKQLKEERTNDDEEFDDEKDGNDDMDGDNEGDGDDDKDGDGKKEFVKRFCPDWCQSAPPCLLRLCFFQIEKDQHHVDTLDGQWL